MEVEKLFGYFLKGPYVIFAGKKELHSIAMAMARLVILRANRKENN